MQDPTQAPTPHARRAYTWRRYLRFWGPRAVDDVDDELQFHFEMRVRDFMNRGLSEEEARAAVLRRLGNIAGVRAQCVAITSRRERRMVRSQIIDAFLQDVRYAFRTLGRQKGWTIAAILTLGLGIGANTAVFSVVNSLILHPLPYPHADRIAIAFQEPSTGNQTGVRVTITPSPSVVRAWLEGSRSFETIEAFNTSTMTIEQKEGPPLSARVAAVRPGFFSLAGQRPLLGRIFSAQEVASHQPVALLSEAMWRARFGADTSVIGRGVTLDDNVYTIIGVAPQALRLPRLQQTTTDLWIPLEITENSFGMMVIGRLREGLSLATASSELDSLYARTTTAKSTRGQFRTKLVPPGEMVRFRESLVLLSGAVALVLLIACANVAHLLLARAASRHRELAVRAAIGASKTRVVRQLLTESLVLATAGCLAGLAIGYAGLRATIALRPDSLAELSAARMNGTALLVIVALSLVTGLGVGVIGAIQAVRHSTHESLKAGALTSSQTRKHGRLRAMLVVTEMALSTTLLVGASLLVRSVMALQATDPGFEPRGLFALNPGLPERRYPNDTVKKAFYDQLIERTRAVPGVEAVTLSNGSPPGFNFLIGALQIEGDPPPAPGTTSFIKYNAVEPAYFRIMGMRIIEGTTFTDSARKGAQILVNQGFARKHWHGVSAIGKRVKLVQADGSGEWKTVVGVVGDAATGGLTDQRSDPTLFLPSPDYYSPSVIVRMKPGFAALPALRSAVTSLDAHLPPPKIVDIEDAMLKSVAYPRFTMVLLATFTMVAVVLAAIGLYGVMAYTVAQRTREIGIRMALGASRRLIASDVIWNGLALAAFGLTIGVLGAWWATKLVENLLYGLSRTDPSSFAAAAAVLLGTALVACIVPTRRATAIDPSIAMRAE